MEKRVFQSLKNNSLLKLPPSRETASAAARSHWAVLRHSQMYIGGNSWEVQI